MIASDTPKTATSEVQAHLRVGQQAEPAFADWCGAVLDGSQPPTCEDRESGGVRCERIDEHGDDHAISAHTIDHCLWGNGFACDGFPSGRVR